MAVKQKMKAGVGPFSGPVRALREALEISQEQAARKLGVALNTWRAWEYGVQQPRARQLEALAKLAGTPWLRVRFFLDIYAEGIKLSAILRDLMSPREENYLRYVNESIASLKELCFAAARGSLLSEKLLKTTADELKSAALEARRITARGPKDKH